MGAPSPARGAPSRRHHRKAAAAIALPPLAIVLGHGRQALAYRPFDGTDATLRGPESLFFDVAGRAARAAGSPA